MARLHRIEQRSEVTIYRLLIKDSIEEKILQLQDKKRAAKPGATSAMARDEKERMQTAEVADMFSLKV